MIDDKRIHLRSFSSIWRIEKRLEHLNGIKLNSIPLEHAMYFVGCCVLEGLFLLLIPPFRRVSLVILLGIPYGLSTFLKKVKLDGKNPIKYLGSLIDFLTGPKTYIKFREFNEIKSPYIKDLIPYRWVKKIRKG